jgi:Mn-dependent DtxR family transcriptional regulator
MASHGKIKNSSAPSASGRQRRKADYLILRGIEEKESIQSYSDLVSQIRMAIDSISDIEDVSCPINYVQSSGETGIYSRSLAEAVDRCLGSGYIDAEDGYTLTESGRRRLSDEWISHFHISNDFVDALEASFSETESEKAKVASD